MFWTSCQTIKLKADASSIRCLMAPVSKTCCAIFLCITEDPIQMTEIIWLSNYMLSDRRALIKGPRRHLLLDDPLQKEDHPLKHDNRFKFLVSSRNWHTGPNSLKSWTVPRKVSIFLWKKKTKVDFKDAIVVVGLDFQTKSWNLWHLCSFSFW